MSVSETLRRRILSLSRIDKLFLVALVLRIALPKFVLVQIFFLLALILFLIISFPRLMRSFLWRVRHRLLVTWVFVGVVPIVLICALLAAGGYILMGQLVGYMASNEVTRESEFVRSEANTLAWSIDHRAPQVTLARLTETFIKEASNTQLPGIGAIVRKGKEVVEAPRDGAILEFPKWSDPEFYGLIREKRENGSNRYYFGAHVALGDKEDRTEVFFYEPATEEFFKSLFPGLATVLPFEGKDQDPEILGLSAPPGRGWWDPEIIWAVLIPTTDLATGAEGDPSTVLVATRSSLITKQLFSNLGPIAAFPLVVMMVLAVLLLAVEMISALFGFTLTRSITRAVADLYQGTLKVQGGVFSHRIPVRKTKDQLSELGGSFNAMTARIEDLIVEVKEKERLENELEIAREVQSQLFPKDFPQLKALQLWGGCQPARTVSGDYYDFVSLGVNRAALAIADISGKGISAALLMAYIQSALRSQLEDHAASSPSVILSVLNNHLYKSSPPEKYATFFLGLYSDEASQLVYTNAGHLAPMVVRRGEVLRLVGDGFPVGLFPGVQYEQHAFGLEPGDIFVTFTDGVTETPNRDGEEFGDKRLAELLIRYDRAPLERLASEITTSVGAWAGDVERHDDTTIVLARRT